MLTTMSYMDAISTGFPGVGCSAIGDNTVYENIMWDSGDALPTKDDLDIWISNYIRSQLLTAILAERDRRRNGGVKVGTNWFHSDDPSRIQQLGLVMFGANMPANIMWKTMSGSFVLMTPTLALQIFQASAGSDMTIFGVAEQKKAALLASSSPDTFDYLTGWPLIYGE
jgi:hypothetical protein